MHGSVQLDDVKTNLLVNLFYKTIGSLKTERTVVCVVVHSETCLHDYQITNIHVSNILPMYIFSF